MRRFTALLAVSVAVVLGMAACGKSSSTTSSSGTGAGSTSAPANTSATTAKPSTGVTGLVNLADICSRKSAAAIPVPTGQTSINYAQAAADLQYTLDHAPAEIKGDVQTLATPLIAYWNLLAKYNGNFVGMAQDPQFTALSTQIQDAKIKQAATNIQNWYAAHCS